MKIGITNTMFFVVLYQFILVSTRVKGSEESNTQHMVLMTMYTNETASWYNASNFCSSKGGKLLSLDSKMKGDVFTHFFKQNLTSAYIGGASNYHWIGLHTKQWDGFECQETYFWQDCHPLSLDWTPWKTQPQAECLEKRCVAVTPETKWKAMECEEEKTFFCEFNSSDCSYDLLILEFPHNITWHSGQYHIVERNVGVQECKTYCETTIVNNAWLCWAFSMDETVANSTAEESSWEAGNKELPTNLQDKSCYLYYFKNIPLTKIYDTNHSTNGTKFYVRDCFQGTSEDNYTVPDIAITNETREDVTCNIEENCYFETVADTVLDRHKTGMVTIDIIGTEKYCKDTCLQPLLHRHTSCWFIDMFSGVSNICRLYLFNWNKEIDQQDGKYETGWRDTLFIKRCPNEKAETTTSTAATTTTEETINAEELRVDKKETSQYRNKFISVYEDTVSKVLSGVLGSVFIAVLIVFVVFSDIATIKEHCTKIGMRNIRKRNICCPRKRKEKTPTFTAVKTAIQSKEKDDQV